MLTTVKTKWEERAMVTCLHAVFLVPRFIHQKRGTYIALQKTQLRRHVISGSQEATGMHAAIKEPLS
jgi:hypothetical protein